MYAMADETVKRVKRMPACMFLLFRATARAEMKGLEGGGGGEEEEEEEEGK